MSDQLLTDRPPRSAKRRRLRYLVIGAIVVLVLLLVVGGYAFLTLSGTYQLDAAIAEADQSDPNWRLSDLEASRANYPDADNSMLWIQETHKLITGTPCFQWAVPEAGDDQNYAREVQSALDQSMSDLKLGVRPNDRQQQALRAELKRLGAALEKARELERMPMGEWL